MTEFGWIINLMKLKLFIILFLLFNVNLNSQSRKFIKASNSKEFKFLTDQNDILIEKKLGLVIREGSGYGYDVIRNKKNNTLYFETDYGNVLWMEKKINGSTTSFFPAYSVGRIYKQFFFRGKSIDEGIIIKVSTEISLIPYSNVSESKINETHNSIISVLENYLNSNFDLKKNQTDFSQKNIITLGLGGEKGYNFLESYDLSASRINQYGIDYDVNIVYRYGKRKDVRDDGSKSIILGFTLEDKLFSDIIDLVETYRSSSKSGQKTLDFLNFTINGIDLREVNTYDLKAMVNIFLGDCKKSNIPVPSLRTLKATFEPLEGNAIAYSYGSDNDSVIIIKVDPEKWRNSSLEKKWYILYHELGHDVLNLDHGEGGKMMYNFADREYNWDEFLEDKKYMFNSVKRN